MLLGLVAAAVAAAAPVFSHPTTIDNRYLPLTTRHRCELRGGGDRVVRTVLERTKRFDVGGQSVDAVVVRDKAYEHGRLVERTFDYFAQSDDGTVYYLGEDVDNIRRGKVVNHRGSWRYGRDTDVAGVAMPPDPKLGRPVALRGRPRHHDRVRPGRGDRHAVARRRSHVPRRDPGPGVRPARGRGRVQALRAGGRRDRRVRARRAGRVHRLRLVSPCRARGRQPLRGPAGLGRRALRDHGREGAAPGGRGRRGRAARPRARSGGARGAVAPGDPARLRRRARRRTPAPAGRAPRGADAAAAAQG